MVANSCFGDGAGIVEIAPAFGQQEDIIGGVTDLAFMIYTDNPNS